MLGRRSFTMITLFAVLLACGSPDQRVGRLLQRSDSAGVDIVRVVRRAADTLLIELPTVRIGAEGVSGAPEELFELLSDLVLLPRGRVAVVDNRGARVGVFDSAGKWLFNVGGRGEGPGEFTAPLYGSTQGDTLFLWDVLQQRLSLYSAEGQYLGGQRFPDWSGGHRFAAFETGYVREIESGQLRDPAPARGALIRTGRSGMLEDTLAGPYPVPERGWVIRNPDTGAGQMVNPPALEIYPPWVVTDQLLARLDPTAAAVEFRTIHSGELVRVVRLPLTAAPPSVEDRDAFFKGLQEEIGIPDDAMVGVRATTVFADRRPPFAGLILDDEGRIWIAAHDPRARSRSYVGAEWEVIDLNRESAVRIRFPSGFRLMAVRNGRAYGITTLDLGVQVVDVFNWKQRQ